MSKEIWKKMEEKGFESTYISNKGRAKRNGKILTPFPLSIYDKSLCIESLGSLNDNVRRKMRLAVIVNKYFNGQEIDRRNQKIVYKDGDHTNLCAENIGFTTREFKNRTTKRKPITLENIISGKTKEFESLNDAGAFLGYKKGSVSSMIRQARKAGKRSMIFREEWKLTDRIVVEKKEI